MKKIILLILFSFSILISVNSDLFAAVTEDHKHGDGETCSECEKHSDEAEGHEGHNHKEGDSCGVSRYHDRFILDAVLEQPWRHPEKLRKDMWLMRIAPLSFLFLLAIALRPAVNKFMKKVGK